MLTSVSSLTPRARLVHNRAAGAHALNAAAAAPSAAVLLRHRQQQTRGFRFGWWPDHHMDREQYREMRRRYRALRHKNRDSLRDRKLLWEQQLANASELADASRRWGNHYWQPKRCFAFGRHGRADNEAFKTPGNPTGVRPGQNIEDVERGAWGHFLFRDGEETQQRSDESQRQSAWTSPFDDIRTYIARRQSEMMKEAGFGEPSSEHSAMAAKTKTKAGRAAEAEAEADFVIDPITNRKISKSSAKSAPHESVDGPIATGQSYWSQFSQAGSASKEDESESPLSFDGPLAPISNNAQGSAGSQGVHDIDLPPTAAELRAYQNAPREDLSPEDASRNTTTITADSSVNGTRAPVFQSDEYVRQHQPKLSDISDNTGATYLSWKYKGLFGNDLNKKNTDGHAVHFDGLSASSAASVPDVLPEKYDDLHKYTPVTHNEPDGKPPGYMEQETYTDLHQYSHPSADNAADKPAQSHSTYDPAELEKYRPVMWNEPDGQPTTRPVEIGHEGYDPEEVQKYQPFRWNEPDGQPPNATKVEGEASYDPAELAKYKPFHWNEPDGQPTTPVERGHEGYDAAEVQKYQAFRWNEPDGQPDTPVERGHEGYDPAEVQRYKAFRYNEPDGKAPENTQDVVEAAELGSYKPVKYQEPDGKPEAVVDATAKSLNEYDLTNTDVAMSDENYAQIKQKLGGLSHLDGEEASLKRQASGEQAEAGVQTRERMESAMARINAESEVVDKMASLSVGSAKRRSRRPLSEAQRQQALVDPYSKEPQGLETSYAEECQGKATWPTYVKTYKAKDRSESSAGKAADASSANAESSVYKILAYDPAMQTINVAETSSAVPYTGSPLTPAEVLVRLSNPTKFFPHFEPLQAQGFEIVSGSGDVLVFRKVRDVEETKNETTTPEPSASQPSSSIGAEDARPAKINPIDMTGTPGSHYLSPPTANFASPTGYVNYDIPSLDGYRRDNTASSKDNLPPPPSSSSFSNKGSAHANVGVRREEPVFSGSKWGDAETAANSKPSVAKRMIVGATWVAGVSYGLGVVGEYMKGN